jgi:hypothetical protein
VTVAGQILMAVHNRPDTDGLANYRGHRSEGRRDDPELAEFTRKGQHAIAGGDGLMPNENVSSL